MGENWIKVIKQQKKNGGKREKTKVMKQQKMVENWEKVWKTVIKQPNSSLINQ